MSQKKIKIYKLTWLYIQLNDSFIPLSADIDDSIFNDFYSDIDQNIYKETNTEFFLSALIPEEVQKSIKNKSIIDI